MRICLLSLFLTALSVLGAAPTQEAVNQMVQQQLPTAKALYEHLHTHPELSLQEARTAAHLAGELRKAGFEVTEKIGGHGIVGVLRNGAGPTLMLRTDLDALPVTEETELPYASKARGTNATGQAVGIMHACGHDMHMTCFAGAGKILAQLKEHWKGTLLMVGQPAEEIGSGALAMLKDGLYTRFPKPDYALALHVNSTMPAGTVGYVEGYALANVDEVDVTIRGIGGHGAWPQLNKDPIVLAAQTILAWQTIVSRETRPGEAAVVTVGSIHAGTKHNIIPNEAKLQLTVRSFGDESRAALLKSIERIARGQAVAAGLPEDKMPLITVDPSYTPATYNDPVLTARLAKNLSTWIGATNVVKKDPVTGGEDFGQFGRTSEKIPISLLWLGSTPPEAGANGPSLHSSRYAPVFEPTARTGITALVASALELFGTPSK